MSHPPYQKGQQNYAAAQNDDTQNQIESGGGVRSAVHCVLNQLKKLVAYVKQGKQIDGGMGVGAEFPLGLFSRHGEISFAITSIEAIVAQSPGGVHYLAGSGRRPGGGHKKCRT